MPLQTTLIRNNHYGLIPVHHTNGHTVHHVNGHGPMNNNNGYGVVNGHHPNYGNGHAGHHQKTNGHSSKYTIASLLLNYYNYISVNNQYLLCSLAYGGSFDV